MSLKVLTKVQMEQFMELGWVKLEQGFSEKQALAAQEHVWTQVEKRGVLRDDPQTWTQPMVRMNENYDTPEFRACKTERLTGAIEDLIGIGRWAERDKPIHWGWWPVNFSAGADRDWDVPTDGWHIDGIHHPQYLDSQDQGLLMLCMFSDINPGGGGTLFAECSHNIVANVLDSHPEGLAVKEVISLAKSHPWLSDLTSNELALETGISRVDRFMNKVSVDSEGNQLRVVETTGRAGDVILGHPFIFHSASQNKSGKPRFICNNRAPLLDKLEFYREAEEEYSPLELSIKRAISKKELLNG
jgi:hypothetical protein